MGCDNVGAVAMFRWWGDQQIAGCCYQAGGSVEIVNILQWCGANLVLIMDTNIDNLYFTQCLTEFL